MRRKDPTEFRDRFLRWKNGENPYSAGRIIDAIYKNNPKEEFLGEPSHNYDFTQSEEWANARGYYPDERGHRDDRVKKPAHPSHPSRGTWDGDKFVLTDKGMQDPNYTLFGLNDGGLDSQAILTHKGSTVLPEITVTPKGNYIYNSYDNIKLHLPKYANGKLPRYKDGMKYSWDDESRSWSRYTGDAMGDVFNQMIVTPRGVRNKFNYEQQPSITKTPNIESDQAYTQRRIKETTKTSTPIADTWNIATGFIPMVGDARDAIAAANSAIKGDYTEAAMLGAGLLIPNAVDNSIRGIKKALTPLRYTRNEERDMADIFVELLKDKKPIPYDRLAEIAETQDIAEKVAGDFGTLNFVDALGKALDFPMARSFGKRWLGEEVVKDLLSRKGFPSTRGNVNLVYEGKPLESLAGWKIKHGERYDPFQFDPRRIDNSALTAVLPYLKDAIPHLSGNQITDILRNRPWLKQQLIKDGHLLNNGNPWINYVSEDFNPSDNIFGQIHPSNVNNVAHRLARRKLQPVLRQALENQYRTRINNAPILDIEERTTSDGAVFYVDKHSPSGAYYVNPETALADARTDFERLLPGDSWALVNDGALSTDSYTLLEALTRRHSGDGEILILRKPDGSVSMQKLNNMGKFRTIDDLKKSVLNLRKNTGENLPDPYLDRYGLYLAPNFIWTKR